MKLIGDVRVARGLGSVLQFNQGSELEDLLGRLSKASKARKESLFLAAIFTDEQDVLYCVEIENEQDFVEVTTDSNVQFWAVPTYVVRY